MRPKFEAQREFEFPTSNLKLTREYYAKYEAISKTLDANPEIIDLAHRDLRDALITSNGSRPARVRFTTEHVLRLLIVQSCCARSSSGSMTVPPCVSSFASG